jgi:Mg-chelatase subunit ChlD
MTRLIYDKLATTLFVALFVLFSLNVNAQETEKKNDSKTVEKEILIVENQIDLVFVLDSTGSMQGLIEGAKAKIWSIANSMTSLPSKPKIRIGLLTYRDKADTYITKLFDLTDDIDKVFADLKSFQADGGGDEPESVNQAIDEAVNKMSWEKTNPKVYKVIFLVGDAPPHMDYQDDVKYPDTCKKAAESGIIINTIQCGNINNCENIWRDIAKKSEGEYARIAQSGDVQVIATPFDAEINKLTEELNKTALAYGNKEAQIEVHSKLSLAEKSSSETKSDRAVYNSNSGGVVVQGKGELVADVDNKKVELSSIPKDELPEELRNKNKEEQGKYIAELSKKRKEINDKIAEQVKKRNEWLENEKKKNSKNKDSFDSKLEKTIQSQADKKFNK